MKVAIVEDGKVVYRGALPKKYQGKYVNVSNLEHIANDLESLAAKGILPLEEVTPDHDRATHKTDGWAEEVQADKVVLTWNVREKTQGELDAEAAAKAIAYKWQRQGEYPPIGELVVALWERVVENRPAEAEGLQKKRLAIKAKYPKPE